MSLKVDITTLKGAETGAVLPFTLEGKPKLDDVPKLKGLKAFGDVSVIDERLLVSGSAEAKIDLECSRCLVEFEYDLQAAFAEEFAEKPQDEQYGFSGDTLDLAPMLRTNLLLAMPEQPVHDALCKGLCTVCGKDLNQEPHEHDQPKPDHPFADLQKLKKSS